MRLPTTISVEITNQCNLQCIMCMRMGERWKEVTKEYPPFIDFELFKNIVDEYDLINPSRQKALLPHFQGEPLLHRDFIRICNYLNSKGMVFGITTNATLLDKNMSDELMKMNCLQSIAFSVDAITKEVYEKIRVGAIFEKTMGNIDYFLNNKKNISVYMNYVIQDSNINETALYINKWAKDPRILGVYTNMPSTNYRPQSFNFKPERIPCNYYNFYMIVLSNGEVYACGADCWYENKMGKMPEQKLIDIWNGEPYKKLIKMQENKEWNNSSVCKDCSCWMYRTPPRISKTNGLTKNIFPFTILYTR